MRLEDFEPRQLGPDDVLVRVRAAAVNPMDIGLRNGKMKMVTGRRFPRGLGHDFAGIVEAVGTNVTRLRVGDEVLGAASIKEAGAFADVVVADQISVAKKPVELSFEAAAALPIAAGTAYQALFKLAKLQPGESVFVHACLGAVGRSAVQLASANGATAAGSCRPGSEAEARDLGVDPIVDFNFDPAALRRRFDVVLDTVGKLPIEKARAILAPKGRILSVMPSPANMIRSALPGPFHVVIGKEDTADLEALTRIAAEGHLRLPIAQAVPLSQAIPALTELEKNGSAKRGKLIVLPG
jgi:NADPH:quinone reductase-like Zn-dependent oxidoreductase